jgi:hypothetical protein
VCAPRCRIRGRTTARWPNEAPPGAFLSHTERKAPARGASGVESERRSASARRARRAARSRRPKGWISTRPSRWRQVPATAPSTRKVGSEWGLRAVKIFWRCSSGRTPVRRAWTRSVASQVCRNRTGAGVSGCGRGAPWEVEQLIAGLVAETAQPQPRDDSGDGRRSNPRPARDGGDRRRAESCEVAANEVCRAGRGRPGVPVATTVCGRRACRARTARSHVGRRGGSWSASAWPARRSAARAPE